MDRCLTAFKRYAAGTGDFQNVKFIQNLFDCGDLVRISDDRQSQRFDRNVNDLGAEYIRELDHIIADRAVLGPDLDKHQFPLD